MDETRLAVGEALRVAVANRGLSLRRVQAHLGAAGHPVALSTLSQWQHGRRVPASPRSFAVVDELERVLRVPAGSLRALLDEDASAGRASCAPVVSYDEAFGRLVEQLDPSRRRALVPLGAHDRLQIDAKGAMVQRRTTMTMRAVSGTDRHVVAHGVETGGDVDLVTVSALGGCRLGRVLRDRPDPAFARGGGVLAGKRSDWLLAATYSDAGGLAIANRALFDDDFAIHRNELRLGWLRPGFQLSAGYLWIDAETQEGQPRDVSELTATTGWQMAPGWWASAETRYDFTANRAQKAELGLVYRNECVNVDLSVSRRFTASDNLRADTDVGLSVRLGGFGRQRDTGPGTVARRSCLR